MEISIETLLSIVGLLVGGSSGAFFTWRYAKKKAKAEAVQAEAEAEKAKVEISQATAEMMKTIQDGYQQMISDMKANIDEQKQYSDEQKQYIAEIKEDRIQLRRERDELRKRQDELEERVRNLQRDVARNCRMVEFMRPFLCGREGCAIRVPVALPVEEGVKATPAVTTKKPELKRKAATLSQHSQQKPKDIEPIDMKDM